MEKSQSISAISKALITFHVKVQKISKDAKNPFFKSSYASLSNILESIQDELNESGLSFVQFPSGEHGLTTLLMHAESGEYLQDTYTMEPKDNTPQGVGSCITYQRRYALCAILALNVDDDDDANKASGLKSNNFQQKPKLTEKAFAQGLDRIKYGDIGVYDSILKTFNLDNIQKTTLENAFNNNNTKS